MVYVAAFLLVAAVVMVDAYAVIHWRRTHLNEHESSYKRGGVDDNK